jgi:hypothetical protein
MNGDLNYKFELRMIYIMGGSENEAKRSFATIC